MLTSVIYREGPDVIRNFIDGLVVFMESNHLHSLREMQMKRPLEFASENDRLQYIRALTTRMDSTHTHSGRRIMHGDRWGHPSLL
jgi:dihydroorotate dehydrogenase (fumarate)